MSAPALDSIRLEALRVQLRQGWLGDDSDVAFLLREYDRRSAELLEANSREVERRRGFETALQVVLARLDDTCAEGWLATRDRPASEQYEGGLCDFIRKALTGG